MGNMAAAGDAPCEERIRGFAQRLHHVLQSTGTAQPIPRWARASGPRPTRPRRHAAWRRWSPGSTRLLCRW